MGKIIITIILLIAARGYYTPIMEDKKGGFSGDVWDWWAVIFTIFVIVCLWI